MRVRFKVSLTIASMVIVCSLSLAILSSVLLIGRQAADEAAEKLFEQISTSLNRDITVLLSQAQTLSKVLTSNPTIRTTQGKDLKVDSLNQAYAILKSHDYIYSVYIGERDGTFLQVIATRGDEAILSRHQAPEQAEWIIRTIHKEPSGERVETWWFVASNLAVLGKVSEPNPSYDPRKRPWYIGANVRSDSVLSDVYVFHSLQKPGITASQNLPDGSGVVGVDITLDGFHNFMAQQSYTENGFAFITDTRGRMITGSMPSDAFPLLSEIEKTIYAPYGSKTPPADDYIYKKDILNAGLSLALYVVAPKSDFFDTFENMQTRILKVTLIGLLIFIPIAYFFSHRVTIRLSRLAESTKKLKEFLDVEEEDKKQEQAQDYRLSYIQEFFELESSFEQMCRNLVRKSTILGDTEDKLNRLVELGIALSAERDTEKVMEMLLTGAKELSAADGGTLYLIEDQALAFKIVQNKTLGIAMGGTSGNEPTLQPVALFDSEGQPNHKNVVSHTVHEANSVNITDAYDNSEFDFSGTKVFDESNNYRSQSFLTVPLKPRGGDVIGALQIINSIDENGNIQPFRTDIQRFVEALAAQAATVIYNRTLIEAQERLLDSMIHLIAGAIDAKSPYTGGHCNRVPELAIMMAQHACDSNDGLFKDFKFETEEEWREFSIGAWLHDCGKVVTPEYVVDKATKLETIYNRIHEIRTRFEVLLREADIEYYKGLAEGGDEKTLREKRDIEKASLIDDFAFVATCNVGGEFLADDKIQRLQGIAKRTWVRHLDIRLGLSHEEELVYQNEQAGPVTENLLSDKEYHVIPRQEGMADQFEMLGFKVDIPENLYNRGEVYNLSVSRGTLTEEERFKINEHVMQTIAMLEALPFPPHLQRVPEYAGTHHETMLGTGYPRRLTADELSIPARIMAVADIFEALTASDRPYKKAKTLSEAVKILSFFKKDQHIDGEVFDLFLTSGVYKTYAERFLLPDQIDDVDIEQYLS